jgi:hypothetical protein
MVIGSDFGTSGFLIGSFPSFQNTILVTVRSHAVSPEVHFPKLRVPVVRLRQHRASSANQRPQLVGQLDDREFAVRVVVLIAAMGANDDAPVPGFRGFRSCSDDSAPDREIEGALDGQALADALGKGQRRKDEWVGTLAIPTWVA